MVVVVVAVGAEAAVLLAAAAAAGDIAKKFVLIWAEAAAVAEVAMPHWQQLPAPHCTAPMPPPALLVLLRSRSQLAAAVAVAVLEIVAVEPAVGSMRVEPAVAGKAAAAVGVVRTAAAAAAAAAGLVQRSRQPKLLAELAQQGP